MPNAARPQSSSVGRWSADGRHCCLIAQAASAPVRIPGLLDHDPAMSFEPADGIPHRLCPGDDQRLIREHIEALLENSAREIPRQHSAIRWPLYPTR
jgi:hypothetical protein